MHGLRGGKQGCGESARRKRKKLGELSAENLKEALAGNQPEDGEELEQKSRDSLELANTPERKHVGGELINVDGDKSDVEEEKDRVEQNEEEKKEEKKGGIDPLLCMFITLY